MGSIQTEKGVKWLCYGESNENVGNIKAGALNMTTIRELMWIEGYWKGIIFVDIICMIEGNIITLF